MAEEQEMDKVFDYIEKGQQEAIRRLESLCRIPSVSSCFESVKAAVEMAADMLEDIGADMKIDMVQDGYPVAVGRIRGRDRTRTLMSYNHVDVVPAGQGWDSDPFEPLTVDGVMFGRGVADNKGPLMARIEGCRAYLKVFGQLPFDVLFLVDGQEEVGCPGLPEYLEPRKSQFQAEACLWESGAKDSAGVPTFQLGVKGRYVAEITVTGPVSGIHGKFALLVENPILQLCHLLSSLVDQEGQARLAGLRDEADDLLPQEKAALGRMAFDEDGLRRSIGKTGRLLEPRDGRYWEKLLEPGISVSDIVGGDSLAGAPGSLPQEARARISFGLTSGQDPHRVQQLLEEHISRFGFSDRVQLKPLRSVMPFKTSPSAPIVEQLRKAAIMAYGVDPVIYPMSPGSGPMHTVCGTLDVPAVGIGVTHSSSGSHGPNENIRLKDFAEGAKLMAALLACM